jgi:outer membrane lipoprotein-sorting protein
MKRIFALALLSAMTLSIVTSQTVDGVIKKYFEGVGGIEKLKSIKSVKMTGVMPTPQGDFTFIIQRKAPNKMIYTMEVMGQKLIPQAFDGVTAWVQNPFAGSATAQKMTEEQAKSIKTSAVIEDPFIDYAKKGYVITYEGTEEVDGIKCDILKLIQNKDQGDNEMVISFYIDSSTGLPLVQKQTVKTGQMAGQTLESYLSDYQDVGNGLLMPFSLDTRLNGQSVEAINFKTIEVNIDIADDIFAFPGEK